MRFLRRDEGVVIIPRMLNPHTLDRTTFVLDGIWLLEELAALNDHHAACDIDIHLGGAALRIAAIDPHRLVKCIRDHTVGLRRHVWETAIPCIRSAIKEGGWTGFQKQRC